MNIPDDRSLFAARIELWLLEILGTLRGINALKDLERSRRLSSLFSEYRDVSKVTLSELKCWPTSSSWEDLAIKLFWDEFSDHVVLDESECRLFLHAPFGVEERAKTALHLQPKDPKKKRTSLAQLKMAPYTVKGSSGSFFDEVVIFDLKGFDGMESPLDLTPISSFITAGTTIKFFYPAMHHARWFAFARPFAMPPEFRLDRKLVQLVHDQISPEVNCLTLGVEVSGSIKTKS